jgi:glycosyltransferase involved in cell wall biosynthesis
MSDSLKEIVEKGELTVNYYNPGGVFQRVIFLVFSEKDQLQIEASSAVSGAVCEFILLPVPKHFFIRMLGWRKPILKFWVKKHIHKIPRVDMVRSYGLHLNSYFGTLIAKKQSAPHVISLHTNPKENFKMQLEDNPFNVIRSIELLALRGIEKYSLVNADQVICVYHSICPYASKWSEKCDVIYNSVPPISEVKTTYGTFKKGVLVGRLIPGKNPANVIRALVSFPELSLDIFGDGPLRNELISLAQMLGVTNRCSFIQSTTNESLRKVLHTYDFAVSVNFYGGVSKVVLEYMASKVPIISTYRYDGELPEVLDSSCVATLDDEESWQQAIRKLRASEGFRLNLSDQAFQNYLASGASYSEKILARLAIQVITKGHENVNRN